MIQRYTYVKIQRVVLSGRQNTDCHVSCHRVIDNGERTYVLNISRLSRALFPLLSLGWIQFPALAALFPLHLDVMPILERKVVLEKVIVWVIELPIFKFNKDMAVINIYLFPCG